MNSKKITLSKSILEMKFMKRTKDKVEKEQFQEEGEEYFDNKLTSRMKKATGNFLMESSYVFCEKLNDGRLSFQGMNPAIEKLMEEKENAKRAKEEVKEEVDVSDEQMTVRWKKMRAKFDNMKKRRTPYYKSNDADEPSTKKIKFLKPDDST
ncbi:M-phase phosphoprotein 6 [Solenopsis invicta]|uniref:M-phase phosphoprotein 6 n=1 Tax=Solenopsis invicta TaxID=13686 RepID=UPI0005960CE6|nr:M-phase phosphoprotein 6 [Solenopsis invicta]